MLPYNYKNCLSLPVARTKTFNGNGISKMIVPISHKTKKKGKIRSRLKVTFRDRKKIYLHLQFIINFQNLTRQEGLEKLKSNL